MLDTGAGQRRVRVAGFWHRLLGAVLDLIFLLPLLAGFLTLTARFSGRPLGRWTELGPDFLIELAVDGGATAVGLLFLATVVGLLYFVLFHGLRGQTPAERLLGLSLIDRWGRTPSLGRALVRSVAGLLAFAAGSVGLLWIAFDREKRGFHDWIAGTYVVRSRGSAHGHDHAEAAAHAAAGSAVNGSLGTVP